MSDTIDRDEAIRLVHGVLYEMLVESASTNIEQPMGEQDKLLLKVNKAVCNKLREMPSAEPNIKKAAKLLSDFIESCPGGDSYLITPNGEELRTDWGYAMEGIQLIHDWAERRTDG